MKGWFNRLCGVTVVSLVAATAAFAQGPRGFGGRGMLLPAVQVPVSALAGPLGLSADKRTQIAAIDAQFQTDLKALMPAPGTQPDPGSFQGLRQQYQTLIQTDDAKITALLDEKQKGQLPGVLQDLQALQFDGIPLSVLDQLNLKPDEYTQLVKIGKDQMAGMQTKIQDAFQNGDRSQIRGIMTQARQDAKTAADAVLTKDQKDIIAKAPPQQGPGFGFGFGRGRGQGGGQGGAQGGGQQ